MLPTLPLLIATAIAVTRALDYCRLRARTLGTGTWARMYALAHPEHEESNTKGKAGARVLAL
jgi:hypothetical protein